MRKITPFLFIVGLLTSVPFLSATAFRALPNRVAAGDVTETSAVVWARTDSPGTLNIYYIAVGDDGVPLSSWESKSVDVVDPAVPAKAQLAELIPGAFYVYVVHDPVRDTYDLGIFRTSRPLGVHAGLRFGVSGDSQGELGPFVSLSNALQRRLDFFVNLGDTIYADSPSPDLPKPQAETLAEFRIKHNEVLSARYGRNIISDLRAVTAFFAGIDDHEVTDDFAGGADPASDPRFHFDDEVYINETALFGWGLQAFQEFNPVADEFYGDTGDPRNSGKRRLYRSRRFGSDAAIFILDTRSYRDEQVAPLPIPFSNEQLIDFMESTFAPSRTMLSEAQLEALESDLLASEELGVTWKFIMVPEPIQNLGPIAAQDRFEGYAAERTELLRFIREESIRNVVFLAADHHGTMINNLTYQTVPFGPLVPVDAFEIINGPVANDAPFGPTVVEEAVEAGWFSPALKALYDSLSRPVKDLFVQYFINLQLTAFGYDTLGLQGSTINAQLLQGGYTAVHVYGWTELEIAAGTQVLTVTIYGIEPYTEDDLQTNPAGVVNRVPEVVSRFRVVPQ
jgi:phosphodiesterase/alkaline phosphatase D-like protein